MPLHYFDGRVILWDRVRREEEFSSFIDQLNLKPPFIVKPNWINDELAHHTDPLVLEWLLNKLAGIGETVVVEAYSARNQIGKSNGDETKIEKYRRTEAKYLKKMGLDRVFDDTGVSYVNVDEEILEGSIADPRTVRTVTETRFGPVENGELYTFIPSVLFDMRGGTLISLAKFKLTFSMATKNLFGLIPDLSQPGGRGHYHGEKDRDLPRNIIDIYKIYCSVFNVVGIVEGIRNITGFIDRGPHHSMFGYDYEVREDLGLVYYGTDPLWLDAFIASQCGIEPRYFKTSVLPNSHLSLGYSLSPWPDELEKIARDSGNPV
jgi:hypothetical protein